MNVETILQTVLASAASAGIVAYLAQRLLKQWLDKDLEAFRAKLAADSARELEQLRGQLSRLAIEHQIRFNRLHSQRAHVIANIFQRLEELHAALRWLDTVHATMGTAGVGDFEARARRAIDELEKFYYPRAIWLERGLCDLLNNLISAAGLLLVVLDAEQKGVPIQIQGGPPDSSRDLARKLSQNIVDARTALEARFRQILGITD